MKIEKNKQMKLITRSSSISQASIESRKVENKTTECKFKRNSLSVEQNYFIIHIQLEGPNPVLNSNEDVIQKWRQAKFEY